MAVVVSVTNGPLPVGLWSPAGMISSLRGAISTFTGVVRVHAQGKEVAGLFYECHERMAKKVLQRLGEEAVEIFDKDLEVFIAHGHGAMLPGEVSVCIIVGSAHRVAACEASRHLIERIKQEVPIWKRQTYVGGSSEWIHGS